jgi:hypothetical protein
MATPIGPTTELLTPGRPIGRSAVTSSGCQSMRPRGTTHSVGWPVTDAIRSKSAS